MEELKFQSKSSTFLCHLFWKCVMNVIDTSLGTQLHTYAHVFRISQNLISLYPPFRTDFINSYKVINPAFETSIVFQS